MMYCYCAYCFLKEHNGFSVKEFACNVRVTEEASLIPGLKRCTEEDTRNNPLQHSSRIIKKAREFQGNIYFCFLVYAKAFDCVDHNKLWTILKEMGIPDRLTCLLRNLFAGQEATVRTGLDWF